MSREIKFRAWLKEENEMVDVSSIDFRIEEIAYEEQCTLANMQQSWYEFRYFEEIELMQYTGLKDKNGIEIYEGDIVQWNGIKMEIFWGEDIGVGYGFCWRNVKGDNSYHESMTGFIDEYEVIGNIYENPELLGGKDE